MNNTQCSTQLRLLELISTHFKKKVDIDCLESPILGAGIGLDSIQVVDLICLIEENWGIEFTTEDLSFQHFSTISKLISLIEQKLLNKVA